MRTSNATQPDYGNWVSAKFVYVPLVVGVIFLALSAAAPVLLACAALFFLVSAYFAYARHLLSQGGGDVQARVQELVLERLEWDGEGQVLDIGCGNAPLSVKLARRFLHARVTGIDFWGGRWEFSQRACERNAAAEGVADRVCFQRASASALPFEEGVFDAAVSNLTFHEVSDAKDKRDVIREALRVVRKGGVFAFQDLFAEKSVYGDLGDLLEVVRSWGVERVQYVDTSRSGFIPWALRLPFMVGTIGILYGKR